MTDALAPNLAIRHFLDKLEKPTRLLVAISGGSDSTGLLHILHKEISQAPFPHVSLAAATVDHALRPEAADEALEVASLCRTRGISHVIRRWDADKPTTGISAAAREARYALLADAARELQADAIVTGHTLDDQIETIAMRATRSSRQDDTGLAGMADAMLYNRSIWILRPLLNCRRVDIRNVLRADGMGWIDDPSNDDRHYERVRTRQAIADDADTNIDQNAGERRRMLGKSAAELLHRHATAYAQTVFHLSPGMLQSDTTALRHALAALLSVAGGRAYLPGREAMDQVMRFIASTKSGRMTAARTLLVRHKSGLFLMRERRGVKSLVLQPGENAIWDGRFHITNKGSKPVTVSADRTAEIPDDCDTLPPGIKAHITGILPHFSHTAVLSTSSASLNVDIECRPVLGAYDRFMPVFELELANALAQLIGVESCLTPPL